MSILLGRNSQPTLTVIYDDRKSIEGWEEELTARLKEGVRLTFLDKREDEGRFHDLTEGDHVRGLPMGVVFQGGKAFVWAPDLEEFCSSLKERRLLD